MAGLIGSTLHGRYFLRSLAGRGGMAEVYYAWDNKASAPMAVKILRRDLAMNPEFKQALEHEYKLLRKLEHPNIVRVFDFVSSRDMVYIVMAWVDGGSLRERIDALGRPSTLDEVGSIVRAVCPALNYAHQMGAFHCDIKPSNIMLHRGGAEPQLADFGVARLVTEQGGGGTLPYMAPEQFQRQVSARSDIYSLGVTVYEMLSGGLLPYTGTTGSPSQTTRQRFEWEHRNLPLPPLSKYNRNVPKPVTSVIERSLNKNPSLRYESALAFSAALEQAGESAPQQENRTKDASYAPPPSDYPVVGSGRASESKDADRAPRHNNDPSPGIPHLYGKSGDFSGKTLAILRGGLSIGRASSCDVRLKEKSASREHATVFITKSGAYVRDDGSKYGTFLNGKRIPPKAPLLLHDGDVVQAGYGQYFEYRSK